MKISSRANHVLAGSIAVALLGASMRIAASQDPPKPPPKPLEFAPRDYFVQHCQRCHGVDGTNYGDAFAAKKSDALLRSDIDRMARGPGGKDLNKAELDVQVVYHRLISDGVPFISWTGRKGLTLTGEVTDGAKLTAKVGDSPLKISVDDEDQWKLVLPTESDLARLSITASLGKKTSTIQPAKGSYSTVPKEPPKKG